MALLCSPKKFGGAYSRRLVCPSVSLYVPNSCPAHNIVIWSRFLQLFHRDDHHIEMACHAQIWIATLKAKVTAWPCSKIVSGPWLRYLKSDFKTISQKWLPYWDNVSSATFKSLCLSVSPSLTFSCLLHITLVLLRIFTKLIQMSGSRTRCEESMIQTI